MASLWLVALAAIGLGLCLWWPRDLGVPDNGLVAVPVPPASEPDRRPALPENVDLLTTYQDVPLAAAARQVTLKGKLGGDAKLTIDVNQRTKVNGAYRVTKSRDVQLKELKMPDKAGRRLFEIVGANVPRWQLAQADG